MYWFAADYETIWFLHALEVFATMTIFGLIAIALGVAVSPSESRRIVSAVLPLAIGHILAAVIVISTSYFELGRLSFFKAIAIRFPFDQFESDTYFGPVLIAMAALYARRHWHGPFARMMIAALIIIAVFSLGTPS